MLPFIAHLPERRVDVLKRVNSPRWRACGTHRAMPFGPLLLYYLKRRFFYINIYQCCILSPLSRTMEINYLWINHCCSFGYHNTLCRPIYKVSRLVFTEVLLIKHSFATKL